MISDLLIRHCDGDDTLYSFLRDLFYQFLTQIPCRNHYFCPSELEKAIDGWVKYYNESRFHDSLDNLTPRDVYLGQGEKIKKIREIIKQNSINKRISENKTMKYQSK